MPPAHMSLAHPSGDSLTYHAPLADMSFALKYGASLLPALEEGFLGDLSMDDIEAVLSEAGRMAAEVLAPLDRTGDRVGASIKDGVVTTAPGWREAYDAWRKGGWNGLCFAHRMGRASIAADRQCRLYRNVERRLHGFRRRPAFDHGRDRRAQCARQRRAQAHLSGKARHRRVDGHDASDRTAGRFGCRRAAHARPR